MPYICTNDKYCPDRAQAFESVEAFQKMCLATCGERADLIDVHGDMPLREEHLNFHDLYDADTSELVLRHVTPDLHDYATGDWIRSATAAELDRSLEDEAVGGSGGAFELDGRSVYVTDS